MEKRNEKWESLRLDVQEFTPKEYCITSCWQATITCMGQSDSQGHLLRYVYYSPGHDTEDTKLDMHYHGHVAHDVTYILRIPEGVDDPTTANFANYTQYIVSVIDTAGADVTLDEIHVANARSTSNHEHFNGWAWMVGNHVHFTADPSFHVYQQSPTHS